MSTRRFLSVAKILQHGKEHKENRGGHRFANKQIPAENRN